VIGMATNPDEQRTFLRQLTRSVGKNNIEEKIENIKTVKELINILTGKNNTVRLREHFIDSLLDSIIFKCLDSI
jgi:hypothetical protein